MRKPVLLVIRGNPLMEMELHEDVSLRLSAEFAMAYHVQPFGFGHRMLHRALKGVEAMTIYGQLGDITKLVRSIDR